MAKHIAGLSVAQAATTPSQTGAMEIEIEQEQTQTQTQPRNTKLVKTLIQAKVTAQLNRSRASKGGRGASHHRGTSLKAKSTPAPSPTLKPALKMSKKPKKTRATNRQVQFSTTK